MTTRGIVAATAAFLSIALAPSVWAQCTTFPPSFPDGRSTSVSVPNATSNVALFFRGIAGRSYSIEVIQDIEVSGVTYAFGAAGNNCPTTTDAAYRDTSGIDPSFFSTDGERFSITAPTTDFYVVRVTNNSGSTRSLRYSVSDTTLFNPAWSTNGTYNTYFSLQNTTNGTCNAALTLRDTAGTVRSTATIAIASGATASTNTAALATARGLTGTGSVTHNCPPGGLLGEAAIANFSISPTPYVQFVQLKAVRDIR